MTEKPVTKKEGNDQLPNDLTKGKLANAVKQISNTEKPLFTQNGNMNDRDKIIFLYQYVLDSKTGIIRNELYEYFIIRALYDHAKEKSLIKEELIKNIENDYNLTDIPDVHITSALQRLQSKQVIIGKDQFSLTQNKITEIKQNNQSFINFMNSVLLKLENNIHKTIPDLPRELIKTTIKNFIKLLGKTFTTYGKFAARIIANKTGSIETLKTNEGFKNDYQRLILDLIPQHLQNKIDEIFNQFLFEPTEEQGKFFYAMAQSHTLLEILNVDPNLKKLQENALKKTKIFLDTNVVIYLLFEESRQCNSIATVIENSKLLGASLYINKITKQEFDNWLIHSKKEVKAIHKIPEKLSAALFSKNLDAPLFTTYIKSLRQNPHQTVDQFCLKFEDITKILNNKYGIQLDDDKIESFEENENFDELRSSIATGVSKGPNVVVHDALCILKVKEYRKENPSDELGPKAWFLTTDSSLWRAEQNVFGEDEIRASITSTLWFQLLSPLISPNICTPNTAIGFSKLISMNFGADSIIDQEDILNITAAFYDDKNLSADDLKEIIGDKHVRDSLKNVHEAHLRNDEKEEERWTKLSLSAVTNKIKGKHEVEIESFKKSLGKFTKRLDEQSRIIDIQSKKITKQESEIKTFTNKEQERKWKTKFLLIVITTIGIAAIIPTILYFSGYVTKSNNVLVLAGIECAVIIAILVAWVSHHKSNSK